MIIANLVYLTEILPFFIDTLVVKTLDEGTDVKYSVPPQRIFSELEEG